MNFYEERFEMNDWLQTLTKQELILIINAQIDDKFDQIDTTESTTTNEKTGNEQ